MIVRPGRLSAMKISWNKLISSVSQRASAKERFTSTANRPPQRLKEGFLWAESMLTPRPCAIRDLSPLSAEVVLWNDDIKPAILRGELFSSADQKEAACILVSHNGNALSLRITSPFRTPSRNYLSERRNA